MVERNASFVGLAFVGLCFLCTSASVFAEEGALTALHNLRSAYGSLSSVHFVAGVDVRFGPVTNTETGTVAKRGKGTFEYWAEGERYRIRCTSDPGLALMHDVEYAFDGEELRVLQLTTRVLSFQRANARELTTALPNPLFLPVDFLSDESDTCNGCVLTLDQAKDARRWDARLALLRASPVGIDGAPVASMALLQEREGTPVTWWVVTRGGRVERLDRVRPNGRLLTTTTLRYGDAADGFPRWISYVAFNEDGNTPQATLEFVVKTLTTNESFPSEAFRIPNESADVTWDSDAKALKENRPH